MGKSSDSKAVPRAWWFAAGGFVAGALIASSLAAFGLIPLSASSSSDGKGVRLTQSAYPLINPLLLCNLGSQSVTGTNHELQQKLDDLVKSRIATGKAADISVYVQQYGSGWLGVNENALYAPASMSKVPLMIAAYDLAESNPGFLSQQVSFDGAAQNGGEYFRSSSEIQPGKSYSISELLSSMIEHSDNTAAVLLGKSLPKNALTDVFTNAGLSAPPADATKEFISVKSYAYFFRLLYNATYLSRDYSQKALQLLSQTDFDKGIRAGVPDTVTVAHKFGERTVLDTNGKLLDRELHDCGIVYKPDAPYLLCVMSKGDDFNALAQNIADISALVYQNAEPSAANN